MNHNPDTYYNRSEVSNSDLTALKEVMHPRPMFGDREDAFRFGSLVDALITEPNRVDYYNLTVDDVKYTDDEFLHAKEMQRSLRMEAKQDPFLAKVLELSNTQKCMINKEQQFSYCEFPFTLDTRCKWDWWLESFHFGGDLKTTFASSQKESTRLAEIPVGLSTLYKYAVKSAVAGMYRHKPLFVPTHNVPRLSRLIKKTMSLLKERGRLSEWR